MAGPFVFRRTRLPFSVVVLARGTSSTVFLSFFLILDNFVSLPIFIRKLVFAFGFGIELSTIVRPGEGGGGGRQSVSDLRVI